MTPQQLIDAEQQVIGLFEVGELPFPIHLSGGNEAELIEIFSRVKDHDWVLGSHRCHYHFLLKGGTVQELKERCLHGRSMTLFSARNRFMASNILAGMCGIAVGLGVGIQLQGGPEKVWCFLGDGAEDEGHFYEAVRFVESRDLPVTFVIEDNDRSVETSTHDRWGPKAREMAWPSNYVIRYHYTPTFPHAGTGSSKMVKFTDESLKRGLICNEQPI
jgi:TPP-dependent pyruvate/acetoin dehydrogenase alpha subunit